MEGERDSQLIQLSNCIELNDETSVANSKKTCHQLDSSSYEESENMPNVAVTTRGSVNIANNEKAVYEQPPPKRDLLKMFTGCMSQNNSVPVKEGLKEPGNERNSSNVASGTARVIVSIQTDLQNGQTANFQDNSSKNGPSLQREYSIDDSEVLRKAKEEGVVDVPFSGYVTKEACCKFVCEILKCVLYQRQQLPMTYDQLKYHQKQQHASTQEGDIVRRPPRAPGGMDWRKCQRTLQDLDDLVGHLEVLFSLTLVPRVLLLLGGSLVMPKELYEINMEEVALNIGDGCLRTSVCLRKIFRTLFVAGILTDARPVHLLTTTVMAQGHRNCGVSGFRPKLDFKVPTRVKRHIINITSDVNRVAQSNSIDWEDYVWFQAPVTIKGFCK